MHLHRHPHFTTSLSAFDLYHYAPSPCKRHVSMLFRPSTRSDTLAGVAVAAEAMSLGLVAEGVYVHRVLGSEPPELHYWRSLTSFMCDGVDDSDAELCVLVLDERPMPDRLEGGITKSESALGRFVDAGGIVVSIK